MGAVLLFGVTPLLIAACLSPLWLLHVLLGPAGLCAVLAYVAVLSVSYSASAAGPLQWELPPPNMALYAAWYVLVATPFTVVYFVSLLLPFELLKICFSYSAKRVATSVSMTAKATCYGRYTAMLAGVGVDELATHFVPLRWRPVWGVTAAHLRLGRRFPLGLNANVTYQIPRTAFCDAAVLEHACAVKDTEAYRLGRPPPSPMGRPKTSEGSLGSLSSGSPLGSIGSLLGYGETTKETTKVGQVVILGAGLDSRFYRLPIPSGCKKFEVDAPGTQGHKRRGLAAAGVASEHVTFVPVNFETQDWFVELGKAGFSAKVPTLFIWEGVTMYLSKEAIDATFSSIASCARGSACVFDFWYKQSDAMKDFDGIGMPGKPATLFMRAVGAFMSSILGESVCFGINRGDLPKWMARYKSFKVATLMEGDEMFAVYNSIPPRSGKVFDTVNPHMPGFVKVLVV